MSTIISKIKSSQAQLAERMRNQPKSTAAVTAAACALLAAIFIGVGASKFSFNTMTAHDGRYYRHYGAMIAEGSSSSQLGGIALMAMGGGLLGLALFQLTKTTMSKEEKALKGARETHLRSIFDNLLMFVGAIAILAVSLHYLLERSGLLTDHAFINYNFASRVGAFVDQESVIVALLGSAIGGLGVGYSVARIAENGRSFSLREGAKKKEEAPLLSAQTLSDGGDL